MAKNRNFMIVLTAIALIACLLSGCGSSTGAHAGITRLDDEGYLYYMDYTKSPKCCAEPAYERIRYFDDTVQRDL